MARRNNKKNIIVNKLDLHGVRHHNVESLVERFIYEYESKPMQIITGLSDEMIRIVVESLELNNFDYEIGDYFNKGYIKVL
jgi:hypothetical protein